MILRDGAFLALRAITAHRMRSGLTLLGIAVGIAAVILLTSIGEGIHRYVLAEFSQFGTNIIGVAPGRVKTGGAAPSGLPTAVRPLTFDDARALRRLPGVVAIGPIVYGNAEIEGNGRTRRTTVYGVNEDALQVFNMTVASGQYLPPDEWENARAFVVLGNTLKRELFGADNALGARLRAGSLQFRVVGVLAPKGQFLGIDLDDTAFIPTSRAMELFNKEGLAEIHVSYAEGASSSAVANAVRATLTARHGREDFTITTQEDMLRTLGNILDILTMAVGALGSISLLVGGVGIVTIMTIAVAERTSEVGLMLALGARRGTILGLFLAEAVVLAAFGGVFGIVLGVGLAQLIHLVVPALPVHTPLLYAVLAIVLASLIGLAAGVLPARRASRLDPVESLRAE
jgi:putative ABC transport system permease protein